MPEHETIDAAPQLDLTRSEAAGEGAQAGDGGNRAQPAAAAAVLEALSSGTTPEAMLVEAFAGQLGSNVPPEVLKQLLGGDASSIAREALREELRAEARAEQAEIVEELGSLAERLLEQNRIVTERLQLVAAALGACSLCFGEDLLCEECDGQGRPGSSLPDPRQFHLFVSPALARIKAAMRRPAGKPVQSVRPILSGGLADNLVSRFTGG